MRVAGERQPGQASETGTRTALVRAWLRPQRRGLVDVHERVAGQERGFAPAVDEPGNPRVAGRIDGCPGAANRHELMTLTVTGDIRLGSEVKHHITARHPIPPRGRARPVDSTPNRT